MNKKAQGSIMAIFSLLLVVSLFYSVSINLYVYGLEQIGELTYINVFESYNADYDVSNVASQLEENVARQTGLPIVDVGALVFYSGNIILDLLLNFLYAIPSMITAFLNGISMLFGGRIDAVILAQLQLFQSAILTSLYILGTIKLILSIRSGRAI